jgi:chaperonin GroES
MAQDMKEELKKYLDSKNIAEYIDDETLVDMGNKIVDWVDEDEMSRKDWCERNSQWLKLATQVVEKKTYPWPDAANVKYPLLTIAAMQFSARAYPALVPGPRLVSGLVVGRDEDGAKSQSADRVGLHMSYQLLYEMEGWEEDMDKMCLMLPIIGCLFKKTYFDPIEKINCSDLVLPDDLVIDYYAKSIESATRKTQYIYLTNNMLEERIRKDLFLDLKYHTPNVETDTKAAFNKINGVQEPRETPATPHTFLECHTFWDLDEDGYDEPYVITVHKDTKKVARVVARFDIDGVELSEDQKEIVRIKPLEYFTKFGFIPNPSGSIYDLGFGLLLGGINETVNTLTNQLLDAGTINNLQAGFLGRGIRIRAGNNRFSPGEWKPVDFTGDDIKKHIFPLPTKEPSDVLFKLLEALVTSGKELASIAEIFVGKMPGQNTPATTTMATVEQGLKVFTAIYKRIYRSLTKEYEKLFKLNEVYLDEKVFFTLNVAEGQQSTEVYKEDYNKENISVKPNADPNIVSSSQKLMKVQAMGALLQLKTINPQVFTKRYLEAIEAENIAELMQVQPQPDPEMVKVQAEMQIKQQDASMKMQLEQMKAGFEKQKMEMEMQFKKFELGLKAQDAQLDAQISQVQAQQTMQQSQAQHDAEMAQTQDQMTMQKQEHQMGMEQQTQAHKMKMTQQKEAAAAKPTNGAKGQAK